MDAFRDCSAFRYGGSERVRESIKGRRDLSVKGWMYTVLFSTVFTGGLLPVHCVSPVCVCVSTPRHDTLGRSAQIHDVLIKLND